MSARLVPACGAALLAALAAPGIARAGDPPKAEAPPSAAPTSAASGPQAPPSASASPPPAPASSATSTSAPRAPPADASPPASPASGPPATSPSSATSTSATGSAATSAPGAPSSAAASDPLDALPARPPPLPPLSGPSLPWERLLDVGGDFVIIARPATGDALGRPSGIRYQPATGFGLHLRFPLLANLHVEGYFTDCHMPVVIPGGALGPTDVITSPPVETYAFGARVSPRLTWGRLSAWVTAGAGWGRLEFRRMTATTASGATYTVRERSGSFVELPLGLGVSFELVPRWISIELQSTAAFVIGQRGNAFEDLQAVDAAGHLRDVGPLPLMDASLLQTIGLSLLL